MKSIRPTPPMTLERAFMKNPNSQAVCYSVVFKDANGDLWIDTHGAKFNYDLTAIGKFYVGYKGRPSISLTGPFNELPQITDEQVLYKTNEEGECVPY